MASPGAVREDDAAFISFLERRGFVESRAHVPVHPSARAARDVPAVPDDDDLARTAFRIATLADQRSGVDRRHSVSAMTCNDCCPGSPDRTPARVYYRSTSISSSNGSAATRLPEAYS